MGERGQWAGCFFVGILIFIVFISFVSILILIFILIVFIAAAEYTGCAGRFDAYSCRGTLDWRSCWSSCLQGDAGSGRAGWCEAGGDDAACRWDSPGDAATTTA